MCLALIDLKPNRLRILHNRDEFRHRPSQMAQAILYRHHQLIYGMDDQAGGTWLAIRDDACFSFVTNYRAPALYQPNKRSRGHLPLAVLSSEDPFAALAQIQTDAHHYNPFNLVVGNRNRIVVFCSAEHQSQTITQGILTVTNGGLNSHWPKEQRLLASYQHHGQTLTKDKAWQMLGERAPAADHELPDTGLPLATERALSPVFIDLPDYGTRCSTFVCMDNSGIYFAEAAY